MIRLLIILALFVVCYSFRMEMTWRTGMTIASATCFALAATCIGWEAFIYMHRDVAPWYALPIFMIGSPLMAAMGVVMTPRFTWGPEEVRQ